MASPLGSLFPVTEDFTAEISPAVPGEEPRTRHRDSFTSLYGHPAATRASVVQAAQDIGYGRPSSPTTQRKVKLPVSISHERNTSSGSVSESRRKNTPDRDDSEPRRGDVLIDFDEGPSADTRIENGEPILETSLDGPEPQKAHAGEQGHAHGSMNMHALILHVIGDALGNVGVIATGLVIWLSSWQYKAYFDPFISLVITVIIFSSALPLGPLKHLAGRYSVADVLGPFSSQRVVHPSPSGSFDHLSRSRS